MRWFCPAGERSWIVRTRWRRVLAVGVAGIAAAYAGVVALVLGVVHYHREREPVRWLDIAVDIALPWRRVNNDVSRGERHLAWARRLADERKYWEAFTHARAGIAGSPANRDGRLLLAELADALRGPQAARWTLVEGLSYHYSDPAYAKKVLQRLLQDQKDVFVVMLAQRYLPRLPHESEAARWFALGAATASLCRGHYDQAEDFLRQLPKLRESGDGQLLATRIEWDRGYRDLALVRLRQLAGERPNAADVQRELVSRLRSSQRVDEARRRTLAFQIAHPSLSWPRIELMQAYREASEPDRLAREVNTFFADFANDQQALLALADFALNNGDVALVERIGAHAAARKWQAEPYVFLAIEARIIAGDYKSALEQLRDRPKEDAEGQRRHGALLDSLHAVAALGCGKVDEARSALAGFLARRNLRAENLLAVANRLVALDATAEAAEVLMKVLAVDQNNQAALTRLIELDIVLNRGNELAEHVQQLIRMRRPSPDLLRTAQFKLGSDLFLFSRTVPPALEALETALDPRR